MLKDLALVVDASTDKGGFYGLSLAKLIDAHLTMVPVDTELPLAAYAYHELRYDMVVAKREGRREAIAELADRFQLEGFAQGLSVDIVKFEDCAENGTEVLSDSLRLFDLIVVEQNDKRRTDGFAGMITASILQTGRPVLIVPYIQTQPANFETVLIAWDGSVPAARAVADALPLLKRARDVVIVQVDAKTPKRCDGTMLKQHLSRHAIKARINRTASAGDIGNTILSYAADTNADLLVMGAYGHSRIREEIFGGTTRTIIESMTTPVLMSH